MEPTFVVIPGRDRHKMTCNLIGQIGKTAERIFLYDNGSNPAYASHWGTARVLERLRVEPVDAEGWPLHRMWNAGIDACAELAATMGVNRWNTAILNNDLEVPADFLSVLAAGLRSHDSHMAAFPNIYDMHITRPTVSTLRGNGQTRRTLAGFAFMLRGEADLRIDEQFEWWFGDDDLEYQIAAAGGEVVCCPVGVTHLEPNKSTEESPERQAMAFRDQRRFRDKWG